MTFAYSFECEPKEIREDVVRTLRGLGYNVSVATKWAQAMCGETPKMYEKHFIVIHCGGA